MEKNIKIKLNKDSGFSSNGFGIGKAVLFGNEQLIVTKEYVEDTNKELVKFDKIVNKVSKNIEMLITTSDIFQAHLMIANDPVFKNQVKDHIIANKVNVAHAIKVIADFYLKTFDTIYDQHLQERRADILDVTNQMLAVALNIKLKSLTTINEPSIIFADDLSPSQTANLNNTYIKGIVLFNGGATSHTAILAKLHNIPLIINNDISFHNFKSDILTIIDTKANIIYQNPNKEIVNNYRGLVQNELEKLANLEKYANFKTLTKDNYNIKLMANISNIEDLHYITKYNAAGVGLFRTEFLYMTAELPSEDYQFSIYKKVIKNLPKKEITIRTFDIGGDKLASSIETPIEDNPFLGVRGIRLALKYSDLLKIQLRALLRASTYGDIKIMFPMIATIEELIEAKRLLAEVENELNDLNIKIGNYKIGIMVEVPSVALNANAFAKHVDFFSIGSNDLIQYTFAADRLNSKLSYLYQPLNPGLLKLIEMTARAAKNNNIDISLCGEMAAYNKATPILIGLGIKTLSMSISNLLPTRKLISKINLSDTISIANKAILQNNTNDVYDLMDKFIKEQC